jgi:uncharacterized protein (DUF2235 family)
MQHAMEEDFRGKRNPIHLWTWLIAKENSHKRQHETPATRYQQFLHQKSGFHNSMFS